MQASMIKTMESQLHALIVIMCMHLPLAERMAA